MSRRKVPHGVTFDQNGPSAPGVQNPHDADLPEAGSGGVAETSSGQVLVA
jgi:hypothetical protein